MIAAVYFRTLRNGKIAHQRYSEQTRPARIEFSAGSPTQQRVRKIERH
jgi:hypothetical protein